MFDLSEKIALVTGASRGIGKSISMILAQNGAHVICVSRNIDDVQSVANKITDQKFIATAESCDISDSNNVTELVKKIIEKHGRIDILINNAGITRDNLLMRMSDDDWNEVINVNLKAAFTAVKAASRTMIKQRCGRIINISSVVGLTGNAGQTNYAASKAGLIGMTKSIARELSSRGMDIVWLGSKGGMEEKIIPKHGYPIHCIHSSGLRGKSLFAFIKGVCLLAIGFIQTISIFLKNKPNIVIGMGGYASGVGGIVAKIFSTRLVIHEQNAIPGTTNRLLSRIANKSFQAFDNSFDSKVKAVTVGNPILFQAKTKNCPKSVNNLLVLGGSLGAKKINELIPLIKTPLNIWHQTGDSHIETTKLAYQDSLHLNVHIESFIENMAEAYVWADLVICRAGAMTISELIATKSIAILIPFPYAVNDHQTQNAKKLSDVGAGLLLDESNLDVNEIDDILQKMTPAKLELMTNILEKLQTENAEKVITDYLLIPSRSNSN